MILPSDVLNDMLYYEEKCVKPFFGEGYVDIVTIHWKSPWRWRTKFRFPRACTYRGEDYSTWTCSHAYDKLRNQLHDYVRSK